MADRAHGRCFGEGDPLFERYHDEEWGFPVLDERGLFERMSLEAFQSGLSWRTILAKRDAFRAAFAGFEPAELRAHFKTDRSLSSPFDKLRTILRQAQDERGLRNAL